MGARERTVIVAKKSIVDLQAFLMFAATELARVSCETERSREAYAGSAGLDYALVLASAGDFGTIADDSDAARAIRGAVTKAVTSALDALDYMLREPGGMHDAFFERWIDNGCIVASMRELCAQGLATGDDLAFRTLTVASDVHERRL